MTDPILKIVELHEGRPLLNDVPGRLRLLADQIQQGEFGEVDFAFIILDNQETLPPLLGYGDLPGDRNILGLLDLAHAIHLRRLLNEFLEP